MKRIEIIGGGLAGLTLGIALRHAAIPVSVFEAGFYPRHRVCGEFISGRGLDVLQRLHLIPGALAEFARPAETVAFFVRARALGAQRLPAVATCISRYDLDATLARAFQDLGGELHTGERRDSAAGAGVVLATGRRRHITDDRGWRWFGLKVHARGVRLDADLEMHVTRDAYVGLCRLRDDSVNVCGLFRRQPALPSGAGLQLLHGDPGTILASRLQQAKFDQQSFCAVAGLSMAPEPIDPSVCRIGDALTMIPPISGNGMSLAFESAGLAVDPLTRYARGEKAWAATTADVAARLQAAFGARLRWAGRLQCVLFADVPEAVATLLYRSTWRLGFSLTRK